MFNHPARFVPLTAALALAGCVADDPDPNAATVGPSEAVTIVMDEFTFSPANLTVTAGSSITVVLVNEGVAPHEFMVGREVAAGGGYVDDLLLDMMADPTGPDAAGDGHEEESTDDHEEDSTDDHEDPAMDTDLTEGHGSESGEHGGTGVTVQPGSRVELTLRIPSDTTGSWEVGCFVQGHYEAGMVGTITMEPSQA